MLVRMHYALAVLVCFMISTATPAAGVPGNFQALYQVHINSFMIGEARVELAAQADGRYLYSSRMYSTGLTRVLRSDKVSESSLFKPHNQHLRPLEYRFDHTGSKKERHAYLKFDWIKRKVTNTVEGHSWAMDIPENALDKLIVHLAVMMDLDAGKQELLYAIADGGKLKEYKFSIVGKEKLRVPAGEYETVKLERHRKDNDRTTYLWCAPSLGYLPVRIKQIEHEDGVTYLSELKQTSLDAQPTAQPTAQPHTP